MVQSLNSYVWFDQCNKLKYNIRSNGTKVWIDVIRPGRGFLPGQKASKLNRIESKWVYGNRAIVEPVRLLTASELRQRVYDYFGCEQVELLTPKVAYYGSYWHDLPDTHPESFG
jgi:hypothetical protein